MAITTNIAGKYLTIPTDHALYWTKDGIEYALTMPYDDMPNSPRDPDYMSNEGALVCWHRRYDLGDSHDFDSPREFLESLADELEPDSINDDMESSELLAIISRHVVILPIWMYEHSGITISCGDRTYPYSDQWDSGQIGWIYITEKEYADEDDDWRDRAEAALKAEIEIYDQFLRGETYGYQLYVREKGRWTREDSGWGFYGDNLWENGIGEYVNFDEALKTNAYEIAPFDEHEVIEWREPCPPECTGFTVSLAVDGRVDVHIWVKNINDAADQALAAFRDRGISDMEVVGAKPVNAVLDGSDNLRDY